MICATPPLRNLAGPSPPLKYGGDVSRGGSIGRGFYFHNRLSRMSKVARDSKAITFSFRPMMNARRGLHHRIDFASARS